MGPVVTGLVSLLICGFVAEEIGVRKNRPFWESFAWGIGLGIIGIIVVALLPRGDEPAPAGTIAVKCTRCNAKQNITYGSASFECWQCKTTIPIAIAH